jgi:phosphoribosylformylglycinamidine synthase
MSVRVLVLRAAGTNCDMETAFAFEHAGAVAERVHINEIIRKEKKLSDYQILAVPGGFTYGDDISSGKILANEVKYRLQDGFNRFLESGKLIIGICNGFQILAKCGLLPDADWNFKATLTLNTSGRFEDRWVYLKLSDSRCIWTKGLDSIIYLPVAHGEGRFITKDKNVLAGLNKKRQVALKYCDSKGRPCGYPDNPNGSVQNIAGICDPSGRIFGLMPHPERHFLPVHHPRWMREGLKREGDGAMIFRNGVRYAKQNL